MDKVLLKFGINPEYFSHVPLDEYLWWKFNCIDPQPSPKNSLPPSSFQQDDDVPHVQGTFNKDSVLFEDSPSISQRIRTLRRNTNSKYRRDQPDAKN